MDTFESPIFHHVAFIVNTLSTVMRTARFASFTWLLWSAGAHAATPAACSWDRPGHNAFTGDVVAAIDHYSDIPADVRAKLKARMAARQYDEMVTIRRDGIVGKAGYDSAIRDMHFGHDGRVCSTVTRSAWTAKTEERGLVYCESGECILVPTVCRNVSRIHRHAGVEPLDPAPGAGLTPAAAAAPVELPAEPPGAGFATAAGTTGAPIAGPAGLGTTTDALGSGNGGESGSFTSQAQPVFYPPGSVVSGSPGVLITGVVPEPGAALLMLLGGGLLLAWVAAGKRRAGVQRHHPLR